MPLNFVIVFGSFACLFPLAFYCLVVAGLNNRRRPTLVSGPADFAGVLLAVAGFLIVGGPCVLTVAREAWQRSLLRGQDFASIRAFLAESPNPWLLIWAGYFVLVVGGSVCLLWRRRSVSVAYNLDVTTAHLLIAEVLDDVGVTWARRAGGYDIGHGTLVPAQSIGPQPFPELTVARAALDVTAVPSMRHVTLRWTLGDLSIRARVEAELGRALEQVEAPDNPAGAWLLGAATLLFLLLLGLLGWFIAFLWNLPR